ncbi:MAG TPA: YHS domain-containing (seleno)protein [Candidatus Methylomirabilis sp.]|nr:YHS domain-containing (seleno)protein [Candidatus Methylomirabilis sp.]
MLSFMFISLLILTAASLAWGAKNEINTTLIGKKAIKGYDPVAYFTDGKPVEGKQEFTHEWKGAKWLFATVEHRDQFKAGPEKYAPQYGGYCAYAVAKGKTADIDPKAWKIVNGKLYLNYDQDIQKKWMQDIPGYIEKADKNWPGVLK